MLELQVNDSSPRQTSLRPIQQIGPSPIPLWLKPDNEYSVQLRYSVNDAITYLTGVSIRLELLWAGVFLHQFLADAWLDSVRIDTGLGGSAQRTPVQIEAWISHDEAQGHLDLDGKSMPGNSIAAESHLQAGSV